VVVEVVALEQHQQHLQMYGLEQMVPQVHIGQLQRAAQQVQEVAVAVVLHQIQVQVVLVVYMGAGVVMAQLQQELVHKALSYSLTQM
jgi:hypothetical protein